MPPDLARGGACNDGNFGGGCRPDRKWVFTPMRNHGLPDGPYRRLPHISDRGGRQLAGPPGANRTDPRGRRNRNSRRDSPYRRYSPRFTSNSPSGMRLKQMRLGP